jgi:hypothetical protein
MKFHQLCALAALLSSPVIADSCMIDPNSSDNAFHLVTDTGKTPILKVDGRLQLAVPKDTTGAVEGLAVFYFQKPAGALGDVYDLVLETDDPAKPQFVAQAKDGSLVLSDTSTGPSPQNVNGIEIVTTIFTVDCKGNVGVTNGGKSSLLTAPSASNKNLVVFNYNLDAFNNAKDTSPVTNMNVFEAYRCPAGQCGLPKAGRRGTWSNGCGSELLKHVVPDLVFGQCCNAHDICYDSCLSPSVSYCNNVFDHCMVQTCNGLYGNSWSPRQRVLRALCNGAAYIYFTFVSGPYGASYFNEYTKERCVCRPIATYGKYCTEA